MKLTIERQLFTNHCTIGRLFIDDLSFCDTLEDVVRDKKIKGETAIPYGTYDVVLDYSNRFKKIMPHVLNVPGFEGIRIHTGNTDHDTEGCILVGVADNNKGVIKGGTSRPAYDRLMMLLEHASNIQLKIVK